MLATASSPNGKSLIARNAEGVSGEELCYMPCFLHCLRRWTS